MKSFKIILASLFIMMLALTSVYATGTKEVLSEKGKASLLKEIEADNARIVLGSDMISSFDNAYSPIDLQEVVNYSFVGYDYVFQLDGNTVQFKFLDIFNEEEIADMAKTLMASLPNAVEYSYPRPGNITIKTAKALTEAQFDRFVEGAKALIYDIIY